MALPTKVIADADKFLDEDNQHLAHVKLGDELFHVFGTTNGRVSTQIRNLQQIAVSATRFADIEDFVKNQMGKGTGASGQWREVGNKILKQLEALRKKAEQLKDADDHRLEARLHLARGWVRAVVGAYLYSKAQEELGVADG